MLCLIIGLSPAASSIIYSLSVVQGVVNYMIPNILVLCCPDRYVPGPFNFGRATLLVFGWAVASQMFLIVVESFPLTKAWTAETFNCQWALSLGLMLLVVIMYLVVGRSKFEGVSLQRIESHIGEAQGQAAHNRKHSDSAAS